MMYALGVCGAVILGLVAVIVVLAARRGAQSEQLKESGKVIEILKKQRDIDAMPVDRNTVYSGLRSNG